MSRFSRRILGQGKGPWLFASAIAVALLVTPFAIAQTSGDNGKNLRGGARNPSENQTRNFTRETEIIANVPTYGTRQSNKSATGGGAIYGCRTPEGGTEKGNRPCLRASNLNKGRAFEFATGGKEVGRITSGDTTAAPFTTNATGVATGLNADQVDGKSADEIAATAQNLNKFAAVSATGALSAGRGAASATRTAEGQYTVVFTDDVSKCAYQATVIGGTDDTEGFASVNPADARTLQVRTRAATAANGAADRQFHLVVTC